MSEKKSKEKRQSQEPKVVSTIIINVLTNGQIQVNHPQNIKLTLSVLATAMKSIVEHRIVEDEPSRLVKPNVLNMPSRLQ